eukprot:620424-Prymnesium_polylepis.1
MSLARPAAPIGTIDRPTSAVHATRCDCSMISRAWLQGPLVLAATRSVGALGGAAPPGGAARMASFCLGRFRDEWQSK